MDDAMQRRCVTAATLGLIALAAYFQASGISQLCAARLSGSRAMSGASTAQNASVLAPGESTHTISARPLLDRSPFDSHGSRPLDGPGEGATHDLDCRGMSATLIASFPNATSWSLAAVTTKAGERPRFIRVGEPFGANSFHFVDVIPVDIAAVDGLCRLDC